LKRKVVLFFIIINIVGSFVWSAEPDHFRKYNYPADGFEVMFPQKPVKFRTEYKESKGGYSNSYQAIILNPFSQHSVFVAHLPKRVFEDDSIEAYLDGIVLGLISGSEEALLKYKKRITFLGFPAIEYQYSCKAEGSPLIARGVALMVDGEHTRLSQISVPDNLDAEKYFQRFIDSFRLLPIDKELSKQRFYNRSRGISFTPPDGWQQGKPDFEQVVAIFTDPGGHSIMALDSNTPAYKCDNYKSEMQATQGVQATGNILINGRAVVWLKSTAYNQTAGIRATSVHYCINTTKGAIIIIGAAPEQTFFRSETIFRKSAASVMVRK
jgi:hypothetical protein